MIRNLVILVVLILILVSLPRASHNKRINGRPDTISYQGQEIRLRKAYQTYEDYKDDPDNIDTNELPRIERLVTEAPVPENFKTREEMIRYVIHEIKFPGYGFGSSDEVRQADGSTLELFEVEIPQLEKNRLLVFRSTGGAFRFIDSIVTNWPVFNATTNSDLQVKVVGSNLIYFKGNETLRQTPLPSK